MCGSHDKIINHDLRAGPSIRLRHPQIHDLAYNDGMDALVLMSGGIDSTACAHYFLNRGDNVSGIFVDYGQPAAGPEMDAVKRITQHYGISLTLLTFRGARTWTTGEILGRNAFLVFAALMGADVRHGVMSLGVHSGTSYYDCSPTFLDQTQSIVDAYSSGKIALFCPFLSRDKAFIREYCVMEEIPLHLTYSCEAGGEIHCGRCLSCGDRHALFPS